MVVPVPVSPPGEPLNRLDRSPARAASSCAATTPLRLRLRTRESAIANAGPPRRSWPSGSCEPRLFLLRTRLASHTTWRPECAPTDPESAGPADSSVTQAASPARRLAFSSLRSGSKANISAGAYGAPPGPRVCRRGGSRRRRTGPPASRRRMRRCGKVWKVRTPPASEIRLPKLEPGGSIPRPSQLSATSTPAIAAMPAERPTMKMGRTPGSRWRTRILQVEAPIASAASTYSCSRIAST